MSLIVNTPPPPYYAVIFTSLQSDNLEGYVEMANKMFELAQQQAGFLGIESAREEVGVTVSYWSDLASIKRWKSHSEHLLAQQLGKKCWYTAYKTRIARVERDYGD
ncbi:antibiotic biosynthesis monooxygenase family protein [Alteromonas sp. ASW11-130]|uniref:antibiotic biosynthesis monooxygenase family protein n=1 Tax=Alteromonas sp. ASW11-130 TaxID=3015775 RepID=UPI002242626D|nr:antibiotic biosynthesis monooxygenase [Alteromonas sp. ASW11-130]MCW8092651.1 antibiotic biosynthesis monooxygenase [Alteromonas sp. ASW11-130]